MSTSVPSEVEQATRTVAFVSNGGEGGAADARARRIGSALPAGVSPVFIHRSRGKVAEALKVARTLRRLKPAATYLVDLGAAPLCGWLLSGRKGKLIVDTGDAPWDFMKLVSGNPMKVLAAQLLERVGYGAATAIVVRGPLHAENLTGRGYGSVTVVPDGVDLDVFTPMHAGDLRKVLGLDDAFVVGVQGNFTWYPDLGGGLGWDAVSALAELRDLPVHVVLVGHGPGVIRLRELADSIGVADRLHTIGRVTLDELPRYLAACDALVLTQTNDPSSQIRTTGKLPCYLAVGKPIIASAVGTASLILPAEMLLPYDGFWDSEYPGRMAQLIRAWFLEPPTGADDELVELAQKFDYRLISTKAADVVVEVSCAG